MSTLTSLKILRFYSNINILVDKWIRIWKKFKCRIFRKTRWSWIYLSIEINMYGSWYKINLNGGGTS